MQVSMLEAKLQFWSENLPPRSFVAIANVSPDEVAAVDSRLVSSVHVLMGELP
jgi:hypothetical protein